MSPRATSIVLWASAALLVACGGPPGFVPSEEGWRMDGGARAFYAVTPEAAVLREGHSTVALTPIAPTENRYGTWMRNIDARPYRGKRVRVSGFVRTQGATRRIDFWSRVQAAGSPIDGPGLGGGQHRLPPDSDWTRYETTFDVPIEAARLQYGVGIQGPGRLWFDDLRLEVLGETPPK